MRFRVLLVFATVFVYSLSATAQTVIEAESKVSIVDRTIAVTLTVEGDESPGSIPALVELLDTAGIVRAQSPQNPRTVAKGKQSLEFCLPVDTSSITDNIAWYRLRYRIGNSSGLISMSELMSDFFELRVISAKDIFAGMTYRIRVRAVNPFSNEPAEGVAVETEVDLKLAGSDQKLTLKGSGATDADGFAVVDFTIPTEAKLDEDGEIKVTGRRNNVVREANEKLRPYKYDVQFLTMTDKPIYQPEQTVNIRGILMKGGEAKVVVSNSEVEFAISDDDDTVLYREKTRSSEFGIASMSWRIPTNAKLGDYRIKIRDENDEQIGGQQIKISRYDLPNFAVEAKAQKPYYLPGENEAEVELKAQYLFGKPVTRGKVRVVQENNREWNWKEQKYDIDEGQVREGATDAEGRFTAMLELKEEQDDLKDDDWRKYKDVHFAAYFTDLTTNKTEQRRFDIRITREPIHVYLIGETYGHHPGLPVNFYVSTFYADGTPAECDVEVKVSEEDADKFKTYARLRTNQYGAGKFSIPRPNIGDSIDDLDFVVIAKDKERQRGTYKRNISFDDDDEQIQIATDRSIYKPGETIQVTIMSTLKTGPVYVDVVNGWSVIESRFVTLKNGKATIQIPYSDNFKGELKVAAYTEDKDDDIVRAGCGVIFPARQGIKVDANFNKALYKPGEDATVNFGVVDAVGEPILSALGIVVLDKAVEERASTDESFGGWWRGYGGWLGYGNGFGRINIKDLNELDLTKPITPEMQLVGEVMLHDSYYYPDIFHSNSYYDEAKAVFNESTTKQFAPVDAALKSTYEHENDLHPVNDTSLNDILARHNISFAQMRDPWGDPYKAEFSVDKNRDIVTITSAGPDKQFNTKDDFTVFTAGFEYFKSMGGALDAAVKSYNARTGEFIRDEKTLLAELRSRELLDRFGQPYKFIFEASGRNLTFRVHSNGHNGKFEDSWGSDDFDVWTSKIDYFDAVETKIAAIQRSMKHAPTSESDFRSSLKAAGINFEKLRDGFGNPLYITVAQTSRYWDKVSIETVQKFGESARTERTVTTPVTQQIMQFTIRSNGKDGKTGTYDDFTLMQVVHVLSEQTKDDPKPVPVIRPVAYHGSSGSIAGLVKDMNGAIIPNVTVTATNDSTKVSSRSTTNDQGSYLITNLIAGTYSVTVAAVSGFNAYKVENVGVTANMTTELNIVLSVSGAASVVNVTSDVSAVDTTSTSVQTTISSSTVELLPKGLNFSTILKINPRSTQTEGDKSTPRLREYFPETLFWSPEVVTNANGKAEVKFKMADTITTWKMYTIASTKDGKIGVAEKEVAAFQPFFVDLDPPKFLTEGDEVLLPSQVRNYTEKKQSVDVTMTKSDWFSFLGPERQHINVESGNSTNAVFRFKAISPVKEGKQRITAVAETDSDAIEKPVTVRPNGQEVVQTDSRVFTGKAQFDISFPANALPRTQKGEIKIYPNLFSHVAESVKGLLERPYGCGEQTISSTYPNLMILKFVKDDSQLRQKAKKYLQTGYERLLGYQVADGGFTYWGGKDRSDISLTAYALRFLNDARSEIIVDAEVIAKAQDWLLKQQRSDGSWTKKYDWEKTEDAARTKLLTTYVARTLAMLRSPDNVALTKALVYVRSRNAETDEPYTLALFGLAALDAGDHENASTIAKQLEKMALAEGSGVYWKLETNTPFNGWGTAGRIETTALVLQLLIRETSGKADGERQGLIAKGMVFLLKNKDRYGVWQSTQTTINVLDAFLAVFDDRKPAQDQTIRIVVNGAVAENLSISSDKIEPAIIDLTGKLDPLTNQVELLSSDNTTLMSQVVSTHYIEWRDSVTSDSTANQSRALKLDYKCDKTAAAIMEDVTCSVEAERIGFRGYGMLLAEIGTPPGADVSRESLQNVVESDWSISRYEVLPDRIIFYMWSKAGGTKFNFKFRPRYGINAQTPASVVYDYYNPEAQTVVAPLKFKVQSPN